MKKLALVVWIACVCSHAFADNSPAKPLAAAAEETPWGKGVAESTKSSARALLAEGNAHFVEDRPKEALEKYQAALALWDHPAIAFNAVRALVSLDRPVDAFEMLQRALRFQAAPFNPDVYTEAQNYQRLLSGLVADVTVTCTQAATATLDGEVIPCPGKKLFRLRPGRHSLAASMPGFIPLSRQEILAPGDNPPLHVQLLSVSSSTLTKTRWAVWKPWSVVAVGTALVVGGVAFELSSNNQRDKYRAYLQQNCSTKACTPEQLSVDSQKWKTYNTIGISGLAVGSVVIAAGVTLVLLNRPFSVLKENSLRSTTASAHISVGIDPWTQSVVASGSF
jgi:tetratricopeptide (TPR) repeat protein